MVQACANKFFFFKFVPLCHSRVIRSFKSFQFQIVLNQFFLGLTDLCGSSTDSPKKVRPLLQLWATSATASCCYAWNSVEVVLQHLCCSIVDGSTVEHDAMTEILGKDPSRHSDEWMWLSVDAACFPNWCSNGLREPPCVVEWTGSQTSPQFMWKMQLLWSTLFQLVGSNTT